MNKYMATGRLTKDNELRVNDKGTAIVKNTIAINRDKDNSDFINFTCFKQTAEMLNKYTHKGDLIGIIGELRSGSYEKDGKKVYTQDLIVTNIEFLSTKKEMVQEEKQGINVIKGDDIHYDTLETEGFELPF